MVTRLTAAFSFMLAVAATEPAVAQTSASKTATAKSSLKFLDGIEITLANTEAPASKISFIGAVHQEAPVAVKETVPFSNTYIESATALQLKYAVLLNTEVEQVENTALFSAVDEWFGTRYQLGGSTKAGIDCSAFVQAIYAKLFQMPMPRTAAEQHKAARQLSRTELKQGDLVFFHTRGSGVSHVGIYLQNNKFVHASSSGGVMISDLFEEYWVRHFVGVGRMENTLQPQALAIKP